MPDNNQSIPPDNPDPAADNQQVQVVRDEATGIYHLFADGTQETKTVDVLEGDRFLLDFSQDDLLFVENGNDLLLEFSGGGKIVLTNYIGLSSSANPPGFILSDGRVIVGHVDLNPITLDLPQPATGQEIPALGSDRYSDDFGSILGGVEKLDGSRSELPYELSGDNKSEFTGGGSGQYSDNFGKILDGIDKLDGLRSEFPHESREENRSEIINEKDGQDSNNFGEILDGVEKLYIQDSDFPDPIDPDNEYSNPYSSTTPLDPTSFSIDDVSISEGGLMTFTVTRTGNAYVVQTIDFATSIEAADNSEVIDFTPNNNTLTFAKGVTSQTFTVQTTQDVIYEGGETFTVTLSDNSAGSNITIATTTGTIVDDGTGPGPFSPGPGADDDTPTMTIGDVTIEEGSSAVFAVTVTEAESPYDVTFTTVLGSAEAEDITTPITVRDSGNNIIAANGDGSYTVPAGETSLTVEVPTVDDTVYEGPETFELNGKTEFMTADTTGTGTITDDGDLIPDEDTPTMTIGDVTIEEGSSAVFAVTVTEAESPYDVTFTTVLGSAEAEDITTPITVRDSGNNIIAANGDGSYTVPAGETSLTVEVPTVDDTVYEGPETFELNGKTEFMTAGATGTGTITDDGSGPDGDDPGLIPDDDTPLISIVPNTSNVTEGQTATFTLTRTGSTEIAGTVNVALVHGTAADPTIAADFTGSLQYLETDGITWTDVPAGGVPMGAATSTVELRIATNDDSDVENTENFTIDITGATNLVVDTANDSAAVTIADNDGGNAAPVSNNDSYLLNEGALDTGRNIISENDTDANADTLTIASVGGTAWASLTDSTDSTYTAALGYKEVSTTNGMVYIKQDGTTQYQHDDSETTSDSFTYTVSDGTNSSNTATVSYTVTPVNDNNPVATNNGYTLNEGALASGSNIITNDTGDGADSDSDLPADTLTIASVGGTAWASLTDSTDSTYTAALGYKEVSTTNGMVYIKQDGTTQYQHDDSETTSDSFTYTVSDGTNSSNTATVSYTVTPVNDNNPIATNNGYTLNEGALASGSNIITNDTGDGADSDSDLPADTLTIASVGGTAWASLTDSTDSTYTAALGYKEVSTTNGMVYIKQDGTTQYQHDDSETTSDSFTYTVSDGTNSSNTATVSYTVTPVNDNNPVATNNGYTLNEGALASGSNIITNDTGDGADSDSDLPADTLTIASVGGTAWASLTDSTDSTYTAALGYKEVSTTNGMVYIKQDGTTQYQHDDSETTSDSFTYTVSDGTNSSNTATVSYTVTPVNDNNPVATNNGYTLNEGALASGSNIITNDTGDGADSDSDLPADTLTIASVGGTAWASLTDSTDSTYTAALGYKEVSTTNGMVYIKQDGTTQYQHDDSETTSDSFTYTVSDGTNSSNTATVSYTVTPVNDNNPVATNNGYTLNEGALASGSNIITNDTGDGADSDSDLPADTLTIASVGGTAWASLTDSTDSTYTAALGYKEVSTTNGMVYIKQDGTTQYQHDDSETTSDSFTYTVSDGTNSSNTATVSYTVTPVNDNNPVATNNGYTLNEGALASGSNIITNDTGDGADSDSDLPADTLTIASVGGTAWASLTDSTDSTYTAALGYKEVSTTNGMVYIKQDGTTQYQHDDSETTSDSFTYTVSDGTNSSNTATVSYTVTPVNDNNPVATNNGYTLNEGALASGSNIITNDTGDGADSDSDLPADTLTIASVGGTAWASLTDSTDSTYTAALGYKEVSTTNGMVYIKQDGTTQYQHDDSETTSDSFTYTVSDGTNSSNTATVSYTVTPVNDNNPVATNNGYTLNEGALASGSNIITNDTGDGADSDSDLPADTLTIASVGGTAWASLTDSTDSTYTAALGYKEVSTTNGMVYIKQDGTTQYQHDDSETTSDSFTYTVSDGTNSSNTATVSYTVTPVNDNNPVATNNGYTLNEGALASGSNIITNDTGDGADSDSDLPADTLTIASVGGTAWASLTDSTDSTYTAALGYKEVSTTNGMVYIKQDGTTQYQHDDSETTSDSFTYTVSDGTNSSNTATVSYTVTPVNDNNPTAADNTIGLAEDTTHILTADDFGFSDIDGDSLASIKITDVTAVDTGNLLYNNAGTWQDVTVNQVITKADIDAGYLVFKPVDGTTGSPYDLFDFTVNDGALDSVTPNTITYNIATALTVSDPAPVDEGKSTVFIIDLSDARAVDTILDLTIGGDVDTNDYNTALFYKNVAGDGSWTWDPVAAGDQVTIAAGDTRVEVKVTTIQNDDDNADGDNNQTTGTVDPGIEAISLTASINNYLEADMANTSDTGSTVINDYPSLIVSAPVSVTEGDDAIFEVTLSAKKTDTTDVVLSLGGEIDALDYDTTGYEYSTDDGATWVAVAGDIEGDTITIPLSTSDGGVDDRIQSVLIKITTLANDDVSDPDVDETLILTATTTDSGVSNANTDVSDDALIVEPISLSTNEDTAQTLSGPAGYTYSILGQGANGTVEDDGAGTLTYTPDTDLGDGLDTHFSGADSFTIIKTNDASGISTTANVDVTVTAVADQPPISISLSAPVADPVPPTEYVLNGSFESYTNPTGTDPLTLPKAGTDLASWTFDTDGNDPLELYLSGGTSGVTGITDSYAIDTSGSAKKSVTLTQVISGLTSGETYTLTFDYAIPTGGTGTLNANWDDGSGVGFVTVTSVSEATATTTMQTATVSIVAGTTNTLQFLADNLGDSGGGDATGIYLDNVSIQSAPPGTYTYNVDISTSLVDTDGSESLQPLVISSDDIPVGSDPILKSADGLTTYARTGDDDGINIAYSWTVPVDEIAGLKLTVNQPAVADTLNLTASVTAIEASNSDTASNSATASAVAMPTAPANDVPTIGDNTLIMANESGFVGSVTDTVETYFSTDGSNTFSWDQAGSTLPDIYSEGQLVTITFDDATGTVTGTIDGGTTTVFSVVVNMQDNDQTDITYNQPNDLLGVKEVIDGGIVLPGGGNNDSIVLGFNDSGGTLSDVDAIIVAHNLIEDTPAEIASAAAEHTVNTNNFYIGVDSNNMNAGDQLIMDFATSGVALDPGDLSKGYSHANDVAEMEISLFNFGSLKSGDELYITVITGTLASPVRETIILLGDSSIHEQKYTVTAPSGEAFIGVEFLAGNESAFKLGIESISSINYNKDFDMTLGYEITDVDGDSDAGTVTISLDGDESILYDSTKTSIDAGDEQDASGGTGNDSLVLNTDEDIDFTNGQYTELKNFEVIDLTQNGNHALTNLSVTDVTSMTDALNYLVINADAGDSVQLTSEWTQIGATNVYEDGSTLINVEINGIIPTLDSIIIDGIVTGLYYETSSGLSGYTEADGSFDHFAGDIVTFKIGSINIGSINMSSIGDEQVFLQDLASVDRTDLSDEYLENMAVLLQSLDSDSGDNIMITQAIHKAFSDEIFNLREMTEEQIADIIEGVGLKAVSEEDAMAHVRDMLIEKTDLTADDFADEAGAAPAGDTSNDIIVGGDGNDMIFSDTFGDAKEGRHEAINLHNDSASGNIPDLSDLLVGEDQEANNLDQYLGVTLADNEIAVTINTDSSTPPVAALEINPVHFDLTAGGVLSDQSINNALLHNDILLTE